MEIFQFFFISWKCWKFPTFLGKFSWKFSNISRKKLEIFLEKFPRNFQLISRKFSKEIFPGKSWKFPTFSWKNFQQNFLEMSWKFSKEIFQEKVGNFQLFPGKISKKISNFFCQWVFSWGVLLLNWKPIDKKSWKFSWKFFQEKVGNFQLFPGKFPWKISNSFPGNFVGNFSRKKLEISNFFLEKFPWKISWKWVGNFLEIFPGKFPTFSWKYWKISRKIFQGKLEISNISRKWKKIGKFPTPLRITMGVGNFSWKFSNFFQENFPGKSWKFPGNENCYWKCISWKFPRKFFLEIISNSFPMGFQFRRRKFWKPFPGKFPGKSWKFFKILKTFAQPWIFEL